MAQARFGSGCCHGDRSSYDTEPGSDASGHRSAIGTADGRRHDLNADERMRPTAHYGTPSHPPGFATSGSGYVARAPGTRPRNEEHEQAVHLAA